MKEDSKQQRKLSDEIASIGRDPDIFPGFILDNPDTVAFASASDVGARTQSSAATVVRFCQALGYEGYVDLQATIQERMGRRPTMVQRLEEGLAHPISQDDILAHVLATDIRNIERLAEFTDGGHLQAAAAEIRGQTMYRVRIGPFPDRARAEQTRDRVNAQYRLDTWVTAAGN